MIKKILTGLILGTVVLTSSANVEAARMPSKVNNRVVTQAKSSSEELIASNKKAKTIKTNVKGYEVINPDKDSFSTETKVCLINGKAPSKTPVTITLYGTTDMTRKNYNLNKLPGKGDYIQVSSETVHAGNLGFFQKQLNLVSGINRIVINFGKEGVDPIEIIVYVYEKAPSLDEVLSVIS